MKFKYTSKQNENFTESGQENPIRWAFCLKTEDGFENAANWMKCKDFLNDICVAYQGGARFYIYGFNTKELKVPEKGQPIYLAVTKLQQGFRHNMGVFNEWLDATGYPMITLHEIEDDLVVLEFPEFFFSNTHHTSLVTLIIRLMNVKNEFVNFEAVIEYPGFCYGDQTKWTNVVQFGRYFALPEQLKKFSWYANSGNNSERTNCNAYSLSNIIHNNGCLSWIETMKMEKL
jgi:hypothetical protein